MLQRAGELVQPPATNAPLDLEAGQERPETGALGVASSLRRPSLAQTRGFYCPADWRAHLGTPLPVLCMSRWAPLPYSQHGCEEPLVLVFFLSS